MYLSCFPCFVEKPGPRIASDEKKPWKFYFGRNANNGIKSWPHVVSGKAGIAQWKNDGLWNLCDVRGEVKCWQGKEIRADSRAACSSRGFSPLSHVLPGGAAFHSLTLLKFHFLTIFDYLIFFFYHVAFSLFKCSLSLFFLSLSLFLSLSGKLIVSNSNETKKPQG